MNDIKLIAKIFLAGISVMVLFGGAIWFFVLLPDPKSSNNTSPCDCSYNVSWGGHTMSVEDAFERAGEGLTIDQWQEVQVMIDNALNESTGR